MLRPVPTDRSGRVETPSLGMLGQVLHTASVDAGDRWSLTDVVGGPLRLFDGLGRTHRFDYDDLRRVTHHSVEPDGGTETLVLRNVYGEIATDPKDDNLRGRLIRRCGPDVTTPWGQAVFEGDRT